MKGNTDIINKLNQLLVEELTAINQYMVHSEMCENWGYERLHKYVEKRSFTEMKHAESLIERILFLDGQPIVSKLDPINIGQDVEAQFKKDLDLEYSAARIYNEAATLAAKVEDNGTRELVVSILKQEEEHIDWLEAQLDTIKQMGIQNYLSDQMRAE